MKVTDYMKKERAEFMEYLEKIKSFGYKVRICKSMDYNYAYIIDKHNVVGYCDKNSFYGINLGTQHHPNKKSGTGFSIETYVPLYKLTPAMVQRCFCIVPQGYSRSYYALVKKVVIDDGSKESQRIIENSIEI